MPEVTPLDLVCSLTSLVKELPEASRSLEILEQLRGSLVSLGYKETPSLSYTSTRALALNDIVSDLLSYVKGYDTMSYSNKAYVLREVSDSYLKIVHAFKVDSSSWSYAQSSLLPVLSSVTDEFTLDSALALLASHLTDYLASLRSSWL